MVSEFSESPFFKFILILLKGMYCNCVKTHFLFYKTCLIHFSIKKEINRSDSANIYLIYYSFTISLLQSKIFTFSSKKIFELWVIVYIH